MRFAALLALLALPAGAEPLAVAVTAQAETAPVRGDADDPAIWVDPIDPARSLILGTDKRGGLHVFGLDGARRTYFADGALNNVDVRPFRLAGREVGLAGATRRNDDTLAFYVIEDGEVRRAGPQRLPAAPPGGPGERGVYGFALGRDAQGTYAIVNFLSGHIVQWRVTADGGRLRLDPAREWQMGSQVEGMVADDAAGHLYVGEEDGGIWRFPLSPDAAPEGVLVAAVPSACLPRGDVEGLALHDDGETRTLVASAQGIDRAAVFRLDGEGAPACVALVEVAPGAVDGVTETDGLDATAAALPGYPRGLLVMMDDRDGRFTNNFKLIGWDAIRAALP